MKNDLEEFKEGLPYIGLGATVGLMMGGLLMLPEHVRLSKLEKALVPIEKQVIGDPTPERFCEIDGKRYYIKIDGFHVDNYFKRLEKAEERNSQYSK